MGVAESTCEAVTPWACERDTREAGLLEQSKQYLLGAKSAEWLKKNEDKAFKKVDVALDQVSEVQSVLQELLDNAKRGVMPQVHGVDGPEDMGPLAFAERIAALAVTVLTATEKAISLRNKVSTGGTNVLTAALLGSAQMQSLSRRKALEGTGKTSRR